MFGVLVFAGNYRDAATTTTIEFIERGSPADEGRACETGDGLVSVDGEPLDEWEELRPMLARTEAATRSTFTVERDGDRS